MEAPLRAPAWLMSGTRDEIFVFIYHRRESATGDRMLADRIEGKWIETFCETLARLAVTTRGRAAILSETQSRPLNVQLAELALLRLGARPFHIVVPTPRNRHPVPVRSTGASEAIGGLAPVVSALGAAGFVVDCTVEGLMHAPETPAILKA